MKRAQVYALIDAERERQREKWRGQHAWGSGDCSSAGIAPIVKAVVLAEECGEVARAILERNDPLEELVQVAAVAVAWIEGME